MESKKTSKPKNKLHPRSEHRTGYDFAALIKVSPELAEFVFTNKYDIESIDFSDHEAVKTLNMALMHHHYGVQHWTIPKGYLCPPVPGRADYLHYAADVLSDGKKANIPKGPKIKILDIGVGSNIIFPMLGHKIYGWSFVGTEIDPKAYANAQLNITNNKLQKYIEVRPQRDPQFVLRNIIAEEEFFDMVICNPPFHKSLEEANAGTARKWKNLGKPKEQRKDLNFGGKQNEIVYPGGEVAFIQKMLDESHFQRTKVLWFTSLIAKKDHLPAILRRVRKVKPTMSKVVEMAQGQKVSRMLCWSFMNRKQQEAWKAERWKK